ncbi:MAG: 16S rRNA (cytosine(1402)-N(4))-methyltransferase RsmH [Phycisphaerae bacterium]|nr:16S rRNA (cytosine(1402)-N(4))-methyltransferase RsmH [Phycisphaerae bacterium]
MGQDSVEHIPVLEETLAERIKLPQDAVMVDATIGHGGHSFLFGRDLGPKGVLIGLDVDKGSLQRAREKLNDLACRVVLIESNFSRIREVVSDVGVSGVDFILADLGICSAQIADIEKGLSFQQESPLDMRLDESLRLTAADIIDCYDEKDLADLIYEYGEDRASRRIARFIVYERKNKRIETTTQLAGIVCKALGQPGKSRKSKIHPATRTFQALRIAVNDELENLRKLLDGAEKVLRPQGKLAVISFHSLEDRIVKWDMKARAQSGAYNILTKKPLVASEQEKKNNPRSRSAKLRIAEKIAG